MEYLFLMADLAPYIEVSNNNVVTSQILWFIGNLRRFQ
jgi:hypothetical protein